MTEEICPKVGLSINPIYWTKYCDVCGVKYEMREVLFSRYKFREITEPQIVPWKNWYVTDKFYYSEMDLRNRFSFEGDDRETYEIKIVNDPELQYTDKIKIHP